LTIPFIFYRSFLVDTTVQLAFATVLESLGNFCAAHYKAADNNWLTVLLSIGILRLNNSSREGVSSSIWVLTFVKPGVVEISTLWTYSRSGQKKNSSCGRIMRIADAEKRGAQYHVDQADYIILDVMSDDTKGRGTWFFDRIAEFLFFILSTAFSIEFHQHFCCAGFAESITVTLYSTCE